MTTADVVFTTFCLSVILILIFAYSIHHYIIYCIQDFNRYRLAAGRDDWEAWDDRNLIFTRIWKSVKEIVLRWFGKL